MVLAIGALPVLAQDFDKRRVADDADGLPLRAKRDPDREFYADTLAAIDSLDPSADRISYESSLVYCTCRLKITIEGAIRRPDKRQRLGENARWLLAELGEAAPLPRLSHKMDAIERRLERGDTGKTTQDEQARLIDDLDRLIEKMRAQEAEQRASRNVWERPGSKKLGKRDVATRREWAKDALRHPDALQIISERFPGYYRDLVFQYYKALAEEKPQPRR